MPPVPYSLRAVGILLAVFALTVPAGAHLGEESLNETEELIASNTPCSELTDDQIAAIGDYYMEQLHPGEQHDLMDEHMGGEGSESLREAHISMGERFYCSQFTSSDGSWMPMMDGTWSGGMWGMGWLAVLTWLGILILIVLGILHLLQQVRQQERANDETPQKNDQ